MNKKQKDFQQISEDANLQVQNWKMAYPERMIVLVEAKANEILFRKLLHPKCKFFIGQGWQKVETALKTAKNYKLHNIIGIIDADFKRITNYALLENLFLTDFHDTDRVLKIRLFLCLCFRRWLWILQTIVQTKKYPFG